MLGMGIMWMSTCKYIYEFPFFANATTTVASYSIENHALIFKSSGINWHVLWSWTGDSLTGKMLSDDRDNSDF